MPENAQFKLTLQDYSQRVNKHLNIWLPDPSGPEARLQEAMRYSVVGGGGKRVRPILVYAAGRAFNVSLTQLDACACAVEIIHAYSLIHDDLPAMDNDDLRRGRPTCHKAFDDATAILAGDALQAFAFEVLSTDSNLQTSAENRVKMISLLAQASGSNGMAGGQAIDLGAVGKSLVLDELENMHLLKTGALIRASVLLGAMCSPNIQAAAFQIHDDILDITADTQTLGKPQGSDIQQNKPTYPALLGLDGAAERALKLHERAIKALENFDESADILRQLSVYIIERKH